MHLTLRQAWFFLGAALLPAQEPAPPVADDTKAERPVESVFEAQLELHRRGFSCGSIDGIMGPQTAGALRAFQRAQELPESGVLDAATRERLPLRGPALASHVFSEAEVAGLAPVPATWLGKSEQPFLGYATALELAAEFHRAHPRFLQQLNPALAEADWTALPAGATVVVPAIGPVRIAGRAARLVIRLAARELEASDDEGRLLAHFPVSIAAAVEKRPVGELKITVMVQEPNFTFDPEVFPESAEGRELGRKLIVPPGPNNPVGRAWIGLDRSGYGIHGTAEPEKVGRTESHGCFRLANWDALTLLTLVRVGLPVVVEP